jgi:putative transposase
VGKWGQTPFPSKWGQTSRKDILAADSQGPIESLAAYFRGVPRPPRQIFAGQCYHIINRANRKAEVFHEPADYFAFIQLMAKAQEKIELSIFAAELMPNHVHLVVQPAANEDIARWMQWLFTTHARHYHAKYGSSGHVWQGRYKHFAVQDDHYLIALLRYVERNALRAKLVNRAEDWRWGSLHWRGQRNPVIELTSPPLPLPQGWCEFVNQPQTAVELDAIRTCVNRQRPFGDPEWIARVANAAGLKQTLGAVGRPRKKKSGPIS